MNFNPAVLLSNFFLILTAFSAAFCAALWLSLIIWAYRDIHKRSHDPLMKILAILVVAILFLPGILIYLILRPTKTIEEEYQQTLEEEALLQAVEDIPVCPGCNRAVRKEWLACPYCCTKLKSKCETCGQPIEFSWKLCPYCGARLPEIEASNLIENDLPVDTSFDMPMRTNNDDDLLIPPHFRDPI